MNRRDFLKRASAVAVAAALPPMAMEEIPPLLSGEVGHFMGFDFIEVAPSAPSILTEEFVRAYAANVAMILEQRA